MSAPIHSLLADELEISEQKAEKLLSAMLREVRKRARREGVRLPDLGKFTERDGELTFVPSESLARAVNHRFEGLDTEDLHGAPGPEESETEESGGPSTITLGYQDSDWSPLDSPEEPEEPAEASEPSEEQGADTEEFRPPDPEAEPSSAEAPDEAEAPPSASEEASSPPTHEMDAPDSTDPDPERTPPSEREPAPPEPEGSTTDDTSQESSGSTEAEELYPLVEDVPGEESTAEAGSASDDPDEAAQDAERDALSQIWNSDSDDDESAFEPGPEPEAEGDTELSFPDTDDVDDATLSDIPTETTDSAAQETPPDEAVSDPSTDPSEAAGETNTDVSTEAPPTPEPSPPQESSSTLPRVLVTLLVLVLLGGGAWYILGQRGMVPAPGPTLGLRGGDTAAPQSQAQSTASSPQNDEPAQGTSGQDASSSSETTEGASPASDEGSTNPARTITPAEGGWTIVVASRQNEDGATALLDTYRQRFSDRPLPVDVVQGTVDNTTRYRVGIGQFPSRLEAQTFLDANSAALPDGAWLLRLE